MDHIQNLGIDCLNKTGFTHILAVESCFFIAGSWWMLVTMFCCCTMNRHYHSLCSWWSPTGWRQTRREILPTTSVWYTCWPFALRERMCLLRSSVTHLCHWMISCTLSPTRIVFQRSVRLSVVNNSVMCFNACKIGRCVSVGHSVCHHVWYRMSPCVPLCTLPCFIICVAVCHRVSLYVTMCHCVLCRCLSAIHRLKMCTFSSWCTHTLILMWSWERYTAGILCGNCLRTFCQTFPQWVMFWSCANVQPGGVIYIVFCH